MPPAINCHDEKDKIGDRAASLCLVIKTIRRRAVLPDDSSNENPDISRPEGGIRQYFPGILELDPMLSNITRKLMN